MDLNSALYFNRFLEQNKGVSYVKDSYLHLGWIALLKGEAKDYAGYAEKVKTLGYSFNERDKQAINEVSLGTPNVSLLKARLLSDGGYYNRSQEVLGGIEENELRLVKDRTEYHYRAGRNQEELGKLDAALENYQQAIDYGRNLKAHFAANSALLMGKIYMKRRNFTAAKSSFNTAIGMKGHLYENSIESAAKDSLKRLN
jgi:tetratricopeptide (TPR) repeat protein